MVDDGAPRASGDADPDDEWMPDLDTRGVVILPPPEDRWVHGAEPPDLVPPEALPERADDTPAPSDGTPR